MKRLILLILSIASFAWAECDPDVTSGPFMSRAGKYKVNYQECHWETNFNTGVQRDEDAGCWLDQTNTFEAGGTLDLRAADSAAPFPEGTSLPGSCTAGDAYRDSDADGLAQECFCTATNTWTCLSPDTINIIYVNPANADAREIYIAVVPQRFVSAGAHCRTNCTTPAQFSFADRGGTAMTLTGGGNLTAGTGTGATTFTTFDTGNTLTAGEGVVMTVANTPTASQDGVVTIRLKTP